MEDSGFEDVADELYGLRPGEFTAARDARAAAARTAGRRDLARQIKALRRPTLAAWAGNLLVRRRPAQVEPLLRLGEALRQAQRDLDGEQLRRLGGQRHALVAALSRQAAELTAQEGQPVGEDVLREVEGTLSAVLADPRAAKEWSTGRLARPLAPPVGFAGAEAGAETGAGAGAETGAGAGAETRAGAGAGATIHPLPSAGSRAPRQAAGARRGRAAAEPVDLDQARRRRDAQDRATAAQERERREREEQEQREQREQQAREQRERRAARAREAAEQAEAAERRARAAERELTAARRDLARASRLRERAERRTAELAERLRAAQGEQRSAGEQERSARTRLEAAEQAARQAGRQAEQAVRRARRLSEADA